MIAEGARLGLYRVGAVLGHGGMGTVYRATSETDGPAGPAGTVVALKVFHAALAEDGRALERFQREAKLGIRLRHGNVVRTHDLGDAVVDGHPVHFLVMELVEGQTLASLVKELGTVPEQLRAQIADQVLDALGAVHALGIVHRDVKPENVVITPEHRVLLMDLGIARLEAEGSTLTQVGEFVGSLPFAAPEQFGDEERVGPRADLYAFGVVLYELATGTNPFPVDDLTHLLRQKLQAELPRTRTVRPDVEPFWDEVIATATRRAPAERFETAAEMRRVIQEGEAGAWWRDRSSAVARPAAERAFRRLRLDREVSLVGRDAALARFDDAWARARSGGGVLVVSGASGVGKSRLVHDALERIAGAGEATIAAGRAVGAGGRSYDPFVEALLDLLAPEDADPSRRRAALEDRLRPLLADTPGATGPLADFLLGGLQPGLEGAISKDALVSACSRVLQRLSAERPLVLVVEDLHLAGPESVEMFRHLARGAAGHAWLLVGVLSDDEVDEGSPLAALLADRGAGAPERLALAPLSDTETEELVRRVVRTEKTVRALARPLYERAEGNALLVLETLANLRAEGALVAKGDGFELRRPLDTHAVPATVRDLVGLRLGRLDEGQRDTLEVASVLGYEFDAPLLATVLGQNRIHLLQRLAGLERKQRLVVGAGPTAYRFATRSLFDAVYASIHPALRGEYHAVVADALLAARGAAGGRDPDGAGAHALLRHLLVAGRARDAEPFVEAGLDHALRSLHASSAAPFLESVAKAMEDASPRTRLAVAFRLWTCYELLASRPDQLRVLATASVLADRLGDPAARARVCAYRAGSSWYAGDFAGAASEAQAGLALAREAGDRTWEATCLHTLGAVGYRRGEIQSCASDLAAALRLRREIGDRRGVASTLQALGLVLGDTGKDDEAVAALEESLASWREIGERRGEAAVLMNLGNRLVEAGRPEEGLARFERAIALHRETGAVLSEALVLANAGHAHEVLGRLDAARAAWERALGLFVELGDPNGELAVRIMLGGALGAYGLDAAAKTHLGLAIALAERTGARGKLAAAHRELGRLLHAGGELDAGRAHLEQALALEVEGPSTSRVATLSDLGAAVLSEGDVARAVEALSSALAEVRRGGVRASVLVPCRLARALKAAGRADEAQALAREALAAVDASPEAVPVVEGPEVYATLADVVEDGARREALLARAREMVEARASLVRDAGSRAKFVTRSWPSLGPAGRTEPAAGRGGGAP